MLNKSFSFSKCLSSPNSLDPSVSHVYLSKYHGSSVESMYPKPHKRGRFDRSSAHAHVQAEKSRASGSRGPPIMGGRGFLSVRRGR